MGELHRLGLLLAAAGEQNHRRSVEVVAAAQSLQQCRRQFRLEEGQPFLESSEVGHDVVEEQHLRQGLAVYALQQGAGGDDDLEVTLLAGVEAVLGGAGGVVDHHRREPRHQRPGHRHPRPRRGGQHDADAPPLRPPEPPRQYQRPQQGPLETHLPLRRAVDKREFLRVPPH